MGGRFSRLFCSVLVVFGFVAFSVLGVSGSASAQTSVSGCVVDLFGTPGSVTGSQFQGGSDAGLSASLRCVGIPATTYYGWFFVVNYGSEAYAITIYGCNLSNGNCDDPAAGQNLPGGSYSGSGGQSGPGCITSCTFSVPFEWGGISIASSVQTAYQVGGVYNQEGVLLAANFASVGTAFQFSGSVGCKASVSSSLSFSNSLVPGGLAAASWTLACTGVPSGGQPPSMFAVLLYRGYWFVFVVQNMGACTGCSYTYNYPGSASVGSNNPCTVSGSLSQASTGPPSCSVLQYASSPLGTGWVSGDIYSYTSASWNVVNAVGAVYPASLWGAASGCGGGFAFVSSGYSAVGSGSGGSAASFSFTVTFTGPASVVVADPHDGQAATLSVDGQSFSADSQTFYSPSSPLTVSVTPAVGVSPNLVQFWCHYAGVWYDFGSPSAKGFQPPVICAVNCMAPSPNSPGPTGAGGAFSLSQCFRSAGWSLYNPVSWVTGSLHDALCVGEWLVEPSPSIWSQVTNNFAVNSNTTYSASGVPVTQWIGSLAYTVGVVPASTVSSVSALAQSSGNGTCGPSYVLLTPSGTNLGSFNACSPFTALSSNSNVATYWSPIDIALTGLFLVFAALAIFGILRSVLSGGSGSS